MKTKKFNKKLTLNKKTLVNLSINDMDGAKGGAEYTSPFYCISNLICSEIPEKCETRLFCSTPYCETDARVCT